ncbi:hypothetical protein [Roseateles amylovorans]|uniref:Uncharacterized protein n=1 Tax=Roseateles amylovorans TaxID=2978473 RepID=A0ABY6B0G7_9BURK|nr:hypothetical protein [Roseateles amylovorans]UXH76820.1 hypothetical protein N4261_17505 [Roseateles amylovorans]
MALATGPMVVNDPALNASPEVLFDPTRFLTLDPWFGIAPSPQSAGWEARGGRAGETAPGRVHASHVTLDGTVAGADVRSSRTSLAPGLNVLQMQAPSPDVPTALGAFAAALLQEQVTDLFVCTQPQPDVPPPPADQSDASPSPDVAHTRLDGMRHDRSQRSTRLLEPRRSVTEFIGADGLARCLTMTTSPPTRQREVPWDWGQPKPFVPPVNRIRAGELQLSYLHKENDERVDRSVRLWELRVNAPHAWMGLMLSKIIGREVGPGVGLEAGAEWGRVWHPEGGSSTETRTDRGRRCAAIVCHDGASDSGLAIAALQVLLKLKALDAAPPVPDVAREGTDRASLLEALHAFVASQRLQRSPQFAAAEGLTSPEALVDRAAEVWASLQGSPERRSIQMLQSTSPLIEPIRTAAPEIRSHARTAEAGDAVAASVIASAKPPGTGPALQARTAALPWPATRRPASTLESEAKSESESESEGAPASRKVRVTVAEVHQTHEGYEAVRTSGEKAPREELRPMLRPMSIDSGNDSSQATPVTSPQPQGLAPTFALTPFQQAASTASPAITTERRSTVAKPATPVAE